MTQLGHWKWKDPDSGHDYEAWLWRDDENGKLSYVETNHTTGVTRAFPWANVNPNPEDGTDIADLQQELDKLKRHGAREAALAESFWTSPIGRRLTEHGVGPGRVTDPDDDDKVAYKGAADIRKALKEQHIEEAGTGRGTRGFAHNAGSLASQVRDRLRRGGAKKDDEDEDGARPQPDLGGEELPGPADLVNPAWFVTFTIDAGVDSEAAARAIGEAVSSESELG